MLRLHNRSRDAFEERRLLRWLYAGTLVLLTLLLWATIKTFDRYSNANNSIRESNIVLHDLESLFSGLKDGETAVRGYILTHDTAYVRPFKVAQPTVERSIRSLDSLAKAGATDLDIKRLKDYSQQMLKHIQEQFLSERVTPIGLQDSETIHLREGRELMQRIRDEQQRLVAETERLRDLNLSEERTLQPDTPLMLLVYSVMAILATALLFWRLFRALAKAERAEAEIQRKISLLDHEVRTREFAERTLKRVLDSSPSGIMAFRSVRDKLGRIVDFEWTLANQEAERRYGTPGTTLIGKRLLEKVPSDRSSGLYDAYMDVVESGRAYIADRHSPIKEGLWLHLHAIRLLDGFMVTITDISETKRAQEFLAEGDRLAITGGIARTIAHEVRNPLTNLHMALEQMLDEIGPEKAEEVAPFADILQRNLHRISKLITDLLESSKAKELHMQPSSVKKLMDDALASVQDRLALLEMRSSVEVGTGMDQVMADPEMLPTALTNLCINAVEAMEAGKGMLKLSANMLEGKVRLRIEDNGKGIASENIQRLFQAFYSGRTGGMGLGLTAARTILNAHGVHMDVESTLGAGTRFTLTFPAANEVN